ncbi:acylneuraminate cytidylyltransferase [Aestuariibaculum sp. M13]|uniref:acylneuraminate cytidylyltransferase n=1 Tax=Aestuariibaculum sp. M13 TaxID=2967132 RepID=UPI002159FC0B|nr:acylneuraminate cytidylyltransferase [Aestuariibaculum sp. M13]MCR8667208.1 acylneuraminate cytidylyltransferase [Aestuariibaculum sp. M13]
MSVIAFIPARGGSKSIPLKNIKNFCGKPLIYWSLKAANDSKDITKVVVATDDAKIEKTVLDFGLNKVAVYRRNDENAQDTSSSESVMLEYIEKEKLRNNDTFLLIQATSPLLTALDLDKGLEKFKQHDSVLSCVRTKRFFWTDKGEPLNYNYKSRPRRQDFDGLLMENGAFYINSVANILDSKNRLSGDIGITEMPEYTAVEIDEEEDWIIAESLMKRFILKENKLSNVDIKLFVTDVDGVLTDAGMYYSESGDELKKFNTHDGMAFQLLRERGIKTAIVTSENTKIVENRAKKLKVDYLYQGKKHGGKLEAVLDMCKKENIDIKQVAYIGDDINCFELLSHVDLAACPNNALSKIKNIPNIIHLQKNGGEGVVREFVEIILS